MITLALSIKVYRGTGAGLTITIRENRYHQRIFEASVSLVATGTKI